MSDKLLRFILKIFSFFLFLLLIVYILYNLISLQIINNSQKQDAIKIAKLVKFSEDAIRGDILTINDEYLVKEEIYYQIELEPSLIPDEFAQEIIETIAKYNKVDVNTTVKQFLQLKKNNRKSFIVGNIISYEDKLKLDKDIQILKKNNKLLKSRKFYYPKVQTKRTYQNYDVYKNIVGYVSQTSNYGLESYYNTELTGINGEYETLRPNADFQKQYSLQVENYKNIIKEKIDGYTLQLTIDSIIQNDLTNILKETYENTQAESVYGTIMDIDDGSIVSMVQYPSSSNKANIKNLNITNLFEPGSIFKPIITSIAINENLIDENTMISSEGFIQVKDRIIRDHDDTTKGTLPVSDIIAHSGNVAMVKIAQMIDNNILHKYLTDFGFDSKTGIDTNYEFSNKMPTLKELTEVRKANVSFGQGIATTQIQMLNSLVTTINGGNVLVPHLVKNILDENNKVVKTFNRTVKNKILSDETSNKIRTLLSKVVTSGTGQRVQIKGYTIGGKTGTAQKATSNGYEKGKYYSSFFAFFPIEKPKYAILITVDEPKGINYYGAGVALPPARKIIEKIIGYNDISPDKKFELVEKQNENIQRLQKEYTEKIQTTRKITEDILKEAKEQVENGLMPNLNMFNKQEVLSVFPADYNLVFNGFGKVKKQNIQFNSKINNKTKIVLEME